MGNVSEYGFRYDPMAFVEKDEGLQGALIRTFVFDRPREEDRALLSEEIEKTFAEQKLDGSLGDTSKETGSQLLQALRLGCAHDRPEVASAAEAILSQKRAGKNANEWIERDGAMSIYALHSLCLLGRGDVEEVRFSLDWYPAHQEMWNDPWEGCPWTPSVFWSALWAGREFGDVTGAVKDGLRKVTEGLNAAGCNAYNDPWGFTDAAGQIDSPEAGDLVVRQIPMILRGQRPNGGWGDHSFVVFRALVKHGLFEDLRKLPPLPADWEVVRSIPAPGEKLSSLDWDGSRFWAFDQEAKEAVAILAEDGTVVRRIAIENCQNIAWWDGALAAVGKEPKTLRRIDPETGEALQTISLEKMEWVIGPEVVGDKVAVGDGFMCNVSIYDPEDPGKPRTQVLGGPGPMFMASENGDVWHADFWAPALIKSTLDGKLLDWGDQPFPIRGLAYDGELLWAIDGDANRICALKRRED
ncbi:MAG: hypothetical protein QGI83_13840 [Candidatus Latescibacteria bacterium]|nr:hypothetical protein [Candidatus Latescibacterota bacterium]